MDAIKSMGGHFSAFLENRINRLPGSYGYESARSSLYAILKTLKPRRIFLPNYICDAVVAAAGAASVQVINYPIDSNFEPFGNVFLDSGDFILLVNYFGLCDESLKNSIRRFPVEQIIVDCSQAYFFEDEIFEYKIFSPRKFLPVADGGFAKSAIPLNASPCDDFCSIRRYQYLLSRSVSEPEWSREMYLQSEKDLELISQRAISTFTKKICQTTDVDFIIKRRRENFEILEDLNLINSLKFDLKDKVPLCYPLMLSNAWKIRENLLQRRVFTPKYWPGLNPANDFERALLEDTVFLPIDHRYTGEQMRWLASIVLEIN